MDKLTLPNQVGTNGAGDPRIPVANVRPGSIVLFGIDDDSTCMVLANYPTPSSHDPNARTIVYFGCMCRPDEWEYQRLFTQFHESQHTVSVLMQP